MKIFGREPAVLIGAVEAGLVLLLSFGLFDLTQDTVGLIMAVVIAAFGVYSAYVTNETLLSAVLALLKAGLALAVVYGFELTPEQTGALIAAVSVGLSLYQRTQVSPLENPSFTTIAVNDETTPAVS